MDSVGWCEAKTHLARILDRVASGETLTITRRGRPRARLVPVEDDQPTRNQRAAQQILKRRKGLKTASLTELLETVHEGHRF